MVLDGPRETIMPTDGEFVGYVWWCQDPVCDCTQAVIVRMIAPTYSGEPGSYGLA